jgi:hypothetical protein
MIGELDRCIHLFFSCNVAAFVWQRVADVLNVRMVRDFESLARWWIGEGDNAINVFYAAVYGICGEKI